MSIVTEQQWQDGYEWTDEYVNGFDPIDLIGLLYPFGAAIAERVKAVWSFRFRDFLSSAQPYERYFKGNQSLVSAQHIDVFLTGIWHEVVAEIGDSELSGLIGSEPLHSEPGWAPPTYRRPSMFVRADDADRVIPHPTTAGRTWLPQEHWGECYESPMFDLDEGMRAKYSQWWTDTRIHTSAPNSPERDAWVKTYWRHVAHYGVDVTNGLTPAAPLHDFLGFPDTEHESTPMAPDTARGGGDVRAPTFIGIRRLEAAQGQDFLQGMSGLARLQMIVHHLRLYYLWPKATHRYPLLDGWGDTARRHLPYFGDSRIQPNFNQPANWGQLNFGDDLVFGFEIPMRYREPQFTRKFPRIINRLDDAGENGQKALFRVLKGTQWYKDRPHAVGHKFTAETPAEEHVHAEQVFERVGGAWVLAEPGTAPDILTGKGLIQGHDLPGKHLYNDLYNEINLLVCTTGWVIPRTYRLSYNVAYVPIIWGDPMATRPSFFIRSAYSTNSGGGWNIGKVGIGSTDTITNPNADTNNSFRYSYTDGQGGTWDGNYLVGTFNPSSNPMKRRLEFRHGMRVSGFATLPGSTFAASHTFDLGTDIGTILTHTIDGTAIRNWMQTNDPNNGKTSVAHVRCWWDVEGGFKYRRGPARAAVADSATLTTVS